MKGKKKIVWIVVFVIVLVIVIPLLINNAFKVDMGIEAIRAKWSADAAISFYGALVAATLTVYGVFLTIRYSQKNYHDDVRYRSLPFFTFYSLYTKNYCKLYFFDTKSNNAKEVKQEGYWEYKIDDLCFNVEDDKINVRAGLSDAQKKLLSDGGFKGIVSGSAIAMVESNHICLPLEMKNSGNGVAVSVRIGFNRKNQINKVYTTGNPYGVGENLIIHIFAEDCSKGSKALGDYILEVFYEDILGNPYRQKHDITIEYDEEIQKPVITYSFAEKQQMVIS